MHKLLVSMEDGGSFLTCSCFCRVCQSGWQVTRPNETVHSSLHVFISVPPCHVSLKKRRWKHVSSCRRWPKILHHLPGNRPEVGSWIRNLLLLKDSSDLSRWRSLRLSSQRLKKEKKKLWWGGGSDREVRGCGRPLQGCSLAVLINTGVKSSTTLWMISSLRREISGGTTLLTTTPTIHHFCLGKCQKRNSLCCAEKTRNQFVI